MLKNVLKFKKYFLVIILALTLVTIVGCVENEKVMYTVTFDSDQGSSVTAQEVESGKFAVKPGDPERPDYAFQYWMDSEGEEFLFESTPIVSDITLKALWVEDISVNSLIQADIAALDENFILSPYQLNFQRRGSVNNSRIAWSVDSKYVSELGVVLPTLPGDSTTETTVTASFTIGDVVVTKDYTVPLQGRQETVISRTEVVPFRNLTLEYEVADSNLELFFEENGSIPYVNVVDFLNLLEGFVDPEVEFTITEEADSIELYYQYVDEDTEEVYDLTVTIDAGDDTIVTNDPGFYWAYIYSTATNYGRHIEYDLDNPDAHYYEGTDVVYNLADYNMDITMYNGEVLVPYYIINQLFAGSSYYNVYYNQDGLYGIYGTPSQGSSEYRTIKSSSANDEDIPADLLAHTFYMLAFNMDNFYGLKDIMGVETYYDLLFSKKDDLLTPDAEDLDTAISNLLLKEIDEPHTSYGYPSYYNKPTWGGPSVSSLNDYGTRFVKWYYDGYIDVDDAIEAKWGRGGIASNAWAASSPNRPDYWFVDEKTAVIILDGFVTSDIEESSIYINAHVENLFEETNIIPEITTGDKFFYYNNSDQSHELMEIIVKSVNPTYVDTYKAALVSAGYTLNTESLQYEKTINDVLYVVDTLYDETYDLFYVGISNNSNGFDVDVVSVVGGDSAVYMEMVMDQVLAEKPLIENVLLDLTWNTGGNVGALYRVLGFITDQPFRVSSIDGDTGGASSSYVYIDGVPSYANLNWGLLISPLTFSAANSMATIFMENELGVIIGKTSGGGASSITPILLPNGTAFTMSSNNVSAYRTGSGTEADPYVYNNNEFGITPDFEVDMADIYKNQVLIDILDGLN